ncbi:MAG TPA: type II toxin-antitoxin system PemK/MazF family toxin [Candidatus Paceibacterota bacterium]
MITRGQLRRGDVVWLNFDPSLGHEFRGRRPAIVVQSDKQLLKSNLVTVVPLTSNIRNAVDDDVLIQADKVNNLQSQSVAKVYCVSSFDYARIVKKIGKVNAVTRRSIKAYLKKHFDL